MTKYNVTVDGGYPAVIDVNLPEGDGSFSGVVTSQQFGSGSVTGNKSGNDLSGSVSLDSHTATLKATINGASITGDLSVGWFWSKSFSGIEAT
jgi:hypothetical protein